MNDIYIIHSRYRNIVRNFDSLDREFLRCFANFQFSNLQRKKKRKEKIYIEMSLLSSYLEILSPFISVIKDSRSNRNRALARSSTISVDVTSKPFNPLNEAIQRDKLAISLSLFLSPLVFSILTLRYFGSCRS